jgi:Domain of unknown function (DUF1707)
MPESYTDHRQPREMHDRGLRAGDRERDAVAEILREQHLAGRLDTEEFQERLDRCYAAKTYSELDDLVADLPRQDPPRPPRRAWSWPAVALVPVLIAAIAFSHGRLLWLAIPLFFFVGRPLRWRSAGGRRGWGVAGCGVHRSRARGSYV